VPITIGSLFSGAGGLDLAAEAAFDGRTIWQCENDPAASKVLAAHWTGVPNLGDITAVDWSTVESVDLLCGGYPCQPFSAAGHKRGNADERHLWPYFAHAIRHIRPPFVFLENVANHRRIGFDTVLGDLAALGFDAQWTSLRASDVGAPHKRERLFVLAWTAFPNTTRQRRNQGTGLRADNSGEVGRLFACDSVGDSGVRWGDYAPSIDRWSEVLGRRPDRPVVKGPGGGVVPSPRFVEWMMGLPDGWVTDVQGISTEQQITLLGNGVVPQQAEAALRSLVGAGHYP
jgi:DNA (cytosine-5)-methyltransferase 1